MSTTIIGIDPGFASCGYAIIDIGPSTKEAMVASLGVLRTKVSDKKQKVLASHDNVRRGRELVRPLRDLMLSGRILAEKDLFAPAALKPVGLVCAESMSFPRSASAAAKVAITWGLIIALLDQFDLPLLQASPQQVKRAVVGSASASKDEVKDALCKRFGRGLHRMVKAIPASEHEHCFDALASAVACLDTDEVRMLRRWVR